MKQKQKSLVSKVADFQAIIEEEDPCEVMKVQVSLWMLWDTIRSRIKECERQRTEEECTGINRDVGDPLNPVNIGSQLEGFKRDGDWTYRNSNPRKHGISRKWHAESNAKENAKFNALYLKSITGKSD